MNNQLFITCLFVVLFFSNSSLHAQASCYNIGFETGTTDGYELFYGRVDGANLDMNPGTIQDQHEIKRKIDGFDEIASTYCLENKDLPFVGIGLGQFSLRLGNEAGGRYVSRITRDLFITPENNFLILNYAVVLEDPSHDHIEQPRFALNIQDENGVTFNCGEYLVTSGPNIDGFENCGDWRVRPWTSAGFELQSFIGQNVRLEITAIDCSLGGHGGYAYIDLNCKPLEIILDNYCEDQTEAYLIVTNGFEKYLWNTGETTSRITVKNPVPGTEYSVQVTSATGCSITLKDTLPEFETLPNPELDDFGDQFICDGDFFYYLPQGQNFERVEDLATGEVSDLFLIYPEETTSYTFVAKNAFGCSSDTITFEVNVRDKPWITDVETIACDNSTTGELSIFSDASDVMYSIDGIKYQDTNRFEGLSAGQYTVYTKTAENCIDSVDVDLVFQDAIEIFSNEVFSSNCNVKGRINLNINGQAVTYSATVNDKVYNNLNTYSSLDSGWYHIVLENFYNCKDSIDLYVPLNADPVIDSVSTTPYICGPIGGTISIHATDDSIMTYSIDGVNYQPSSEFQNVYTGAHTVYALDSDNCRTNHSVFVSELPSEIKLSIADQRNPSCTLNNGFVQFNTEAGYPEYKYSLNGSNFEAQTLFDELSEGSYRAVVKDKYFCLDTLEFSLSNTARPELVVNSSYSGKCGEEDGLVRLYCRHGIPPYEYAIADYNFSEEVEFNNLNTGFHTFYVKDALECLDTIEVYLKDACDLYIPNVITTSSDSSIDGLFFIQGKSTAVINIDQLSVYNRWGNLIYQEEDLTPNDEDAEWWNGTFDGAKLPIGVYTYILSYTEYGEDERQITGTVSLF